MEKGWRKEEGGIKMKGKIESRMKEDNDGIKVKREFGIKVDDRVAVDTKEKVENKEKGKVDHHNSEKRNEMKTREAVAMRMNEKVEDRVKGKAGIPMAEAIGHKMKDDHLKNTNHEKLGINLKARDGSKMKGEVGIEVKEKDGITFKKNVGIGMNEKVDDKLKNKFEIKVKEEFGNLVEEVGSKIKDELRVKIKEEVVNKMQSAIGNKAKGVDMSSTMEKMRRNTRIEAKEEVGDKMELQSEKIGHSIEENVRSTGQKDSRTHKMKEDGIKIKGDNQKEIITRNVNKEIEDNMKVRSGLEKEKDHGYDLQETIRGTVQKDIGTRRKDEDAIKLKRDIKNKILTKDVNREIVDNVKVQSGLEKKIEKGHDLKENVDGIIQKGVGIHEKEEYGIKMKGGIENKLISRDVNKENLKINSELELKKENGHDIKGKVVGILQKDVGTHRKGVCGMKMKGDIQNKIITREANKETVGNVKVQSKLEDKRENRHCLKETVKSIMQKNVGILRKEEDSVKMRRGVESEVTFGHENGEVEGKIREKFEDNDRFLMMERLEYSIEKEVECMIKGEKQNERKDVVGEEIKKNHGIENKIKDSVGITTEDETGNKTLEEVEKTKRREFVDSIKEKVKNELRNESKVRVKEIDGILPTKVDERIKIKGETGKTILKRSETMKEDEVVNERKEKVGHKTKELRTKIEGKSGIKGKEEIKDGIKEKVGDKMKDKGRKEKVEDTMRARHVVMKDGKNGIKMKEDVENKTKEKVVSIKEKEVEHNMKDNAGIKIKGKVENMMIERARFIKQKDVGSKMKAKVEHNTREELGTKSREKDERLGIRMKEEVEHKTKNKGAVKKEERIGIKLKGEAKIKKEKE